jgi:hypothetical protein
MRIERRLMWQMWRMWMTGLALLACAACPGRLHDKDRFLGEAGASCGDVVANVFVPKCGSSNCHGSSAPQQGLDLVSAGVAARVVGMTAKACAATLADPENPEASLLYTKLAPNPPCGGQMPLAQSPLSDAETACVLKWIAAQ